MSEPMPEPVQRRDSVASKKPRQWVGEKWVTHVWVQGFPVGTPTKTATLQAMADAEKSVKGEVVHHEVLTTPEHEAAGEFIVKLLIHDKDKPARTRKPKGRGDVK